MSDKVRNPKDCFSLVSNSVGRCCINFIEMPHFSYLMFQLMFVRIVSRLLQKISKKKKKHPKGHTKFEYQRPIGHVAHLSNAEMLRL